jgi:hypothetical protein
MGKTIIVILICLWVGVAGAYEKNTVWDRYVKSGKIEYKHFEQIDFNEVSQKHLNLPQNIFASVKSLTKFNHGRNDLEDLFDIKMVEEIEKREIGSLSELEKLTIKQMLELAIDITQRSMFYQYDRYLLRTQHNMKIDSVECFLDGCGVCEDYARTLARVYYWIKPFNSKLKNLFMLYTAGDTFEATTADKANQLLAVGRPILHAWNIMVYFTDEKMVYSHIDTTGAEGEYGQMQEGKVGYHLSESNRINQAQLLYSLGEYEASLNLLFREFGKSRDLKKQAAVERIRTLNRLVSLTDMIEDSDLSCKYYKQLLRLVPENTRFKTNVQTCCPTSKQ